MRCVVSLVLALSAAGILLAPAATAAAREATRRLPAAPETGRPTALCFSGTNGNGCVVAMRGAIHLTAQRSAAGARDNGDNGRANAGDDRRTSQETSESERADRTSTRGDRSARSSRNDEGEDDEDDKNGKKAKEGEDDQDEGQDTADIFGFTDGSDTAEAGTRALFNDTVGRFSRHAGSYRALGSSTGFAYAPSDKLIVAVYASSDFQHNRQDIASLTDPPDVDTPLRGSLSIGLGAAAKYQLRERGASGVGLAVQAAPYWSKESVSGGIGVDTYGVDLRLIADHALVGDRIFAAVNIAYRPEATYQTPDNVRHEEANFEAAGAVSMHITDKLRLGAEVRYLTKYEGALFSEFMGWALFAGPFAYLSLSDEAYIGLAWSMQLAGRAAGDTGAYLDLENYERHQFRLKYGIAF